MSSRRWVPDDRVRNVTQCKPENDRHLRSARCFRHHSPRSQTSAHFYDIIWRNIQEDIRLQTKCLLGNLTGTDLLGRNLQVDRSTTLSWNCGCGLNLTGTVYDFMAGSCNRGNKPSDSIKGGEFIDQLSDCQPINENSVPRSYTIRTLCYA
jgi:hypothetical protein